jgi:hypothetical protein
MDTMKAARVMQMVIPNLIKRGVKAPDYVALGKAVTAKIEALPDATARDIAIAILDGRAD